MSGLFPNDVNLDNIKLVSTANETLDAPLRGAIGRSFAFDYATQKFIVTEGKIVEPSKIDAIKQWIELYIRTDVLKYKIYDEHFGVDLSDLVSYRLPRGFQVSEIVRRINEGILTMCPDVVSVTKWAFDRGHFSFTVTTQTGEEVAIYV